MATNPGALSQPIVPRARPTDVLPTNLRLTERHPWLYPAAVRVHQSRRHLAWLCSDASFATTRTATELPVRVKKHASLLMRELDSTHDSGQHTQDEHATWQQHKVVNLRLASARTDRLLIGPGETFSFNKVVGNCTRRRGYLVGMRLSNGDAKPGVGGGICQLANLLHWMFLHSPLTVVERSEHSFDPFPDKARVLPWGVGCSIVYNYVDLVVRNDTDLTFAVHTWVDERHLRGDLRADESPAHTYRVEARDEEFVRGEDGRVWRRNEIWRTLVDRRTGNHVGEELVKRNRALVKYPVPDQPAAPHTTTDPRSTTLDGRASTVTS